ncbi:VCBS repeat-containing protein [Plantactinospora sp. BC1]|uniref:FG-GAP repeat domain-containing protein n=1 Tax=Plantactinospora sp. BC1 TaxID=2108470 RepID=UPI00131F3A22|nr:VCBS repeat-containing protein [Plantactinospora sp. BC1]
MDRRRRPVGAVLGERRARTAGRRPHGWLAVLLCAGTLAAAIPAPAGAAGAFQPIHGDMNGDGRVDRVTSGGSGDRCRISVAHGLPQGGYGPVTDHYYRLPGFTGRIIDCPDTGEYVDLGGDATPELVLAWFNGPSNSLGYCTLVLREYRPIATHRFVCRPGGIHSADFDGDGLRDIYIVTDDPDGFQTYRNTPAGRLVPGAPSHWGNNRGYHIADFDGDGGMDVVLHYIEGAERPYEGFVAAFGDGTKVQLAGEDEYETFRVVDADRDGRPDVELRTPSVVSVRINRGDQTFVEAPLANGERVDAWRGRPNVLAVRANDYASWNAALSVTGQPRYGRVTRSASGRELVYERTAAHGLADTFSYRLSQNGRSDTANVTVRMRD